MKTWYWDFGYDPDRKASFVRTPPGGYRGNKECVFAVPASHFPADRVGEYQLLGQPSVFCPMQRIYV
jgi:hypothetical protein